MFSYVSQKILSLTLMSGVTAYVFSTRVTVGVGSASGAVEVVFAWPLGGGSMGFALWLVYVRLFGGCGDVVLQVVAWAGLA